MCLSLIDGRRLVGSSDFADSFGSVARFALVRDRQSLSVAGEQRTYYDAKYVYRCFVYNCRRSFKIFHRLLRYLVIGRDGIALTDVSHIELYPRKCQCQSVSVNIQNHETTRNRMRDRKVRTEDVRRRNT